MEGGNIQSIFLSILTSIVIGGFVLVFVEIGNRKNRELDRHYQIMGPFMHKLSAYFRFMNWCRGLIIYPTNLNENESSFKKLVDEVGKYGGKLINYGSDYEIDHFSANQLYNICTNIISNIWYFYDKMHPCHLRCEVSIVSKDFIAKELKEIFPNYLSRSLDIDLLSKVSGDFYTDLYQPIESETFKHESYLRHYKRQTVFVATAVVILLVVLVALLFTSLSVGFMQTVSVLVIILFVLCLLLLGVETKIQIEFWSQFSNYFKTKYKTVKRRLRQTFTNLR